MPWANFRCWVMPIESTQLITVTLHDSLLLKSSATRSFVQEFVQINSEENIKFRHYLSFFEGNLSVTDGFLSQRSSNAESVPMPWRHMWSGIWGSYRIRVAHGPGMPGTFSPPPPVSDPDMHHGTCVTHVTWCMSGSLTSGFPLKSVAAKTFPAFPARAQHTILRIW